MRRTLKEVAALTGFSASTISRVLTNNSNVNAATRKEVLEALEKVDYVPMRAARKKTKAHKKMVMVVDGEFSSQFHSKLMERICARLREREYSALVGYSGYDQKAEERYIAYAQEQGFDGIILAAPIETPALKRLVANSPCHIVLVSRFLRSIDLDAVYIDNYRVGYMSASHLLEMGHRRVACLSGGRTSNSLIDRTQGFVDALRDAGVPKEDLWIWDSDLKKKSGELFAREFLSSNRGCTAVFSTSEPLAAGFVEYALDAGLKIPDDVGVICVSPAPPVFGGNVRITCIIHDAEFLGDKAVEMLFDRIAGLQDPPRRLIYPPQLHIQDSVKKI